MGIGNLGITEMAVIFVIALIVFGPRKLPELGRSLGSAMREFRRSINEIQREIEDSDPTRTVRDEFRAVRDDTRSILGPDRDPSRRRQRTESGEIAQVPGESASPRGDATSDDAGTSTEPDSSSG